MLSTNGFARRLLLGSLLVALVSVDHPEAKGFQVLYSFQNMDDGALPWAELIADNSGNLYGTTYSGGSGTVFKVALDGTETILHFFGAYKGDGALPQSPLIMDASGNVYGTTTYGGASNCGTVFRLAPDETESVLYSFTCKQDGNSPHGGLLLDKRGALYGTALGTDGYNDGTVFKVTPDGKFRVLHAFTGSDGYFPFAGVIADKTGNLYGTTAYGGTFGYGTVYEISPTGVESVLYSFTGGADSCTPVSSLFRDTSGNLYGTAASAPGSCGGSGVVYKLASDGTFSVLHTFSGNDGAYPDGNVIRDKRGNLYGTTSEGGDNGSGVLFKIASDGNFRLLYTSQDRDNCVGSYGGLLLLNSVLYGTATYCGLYDLGTVFKLDK